MPGGERRDVTVRLGLEIERAHMTGVLLFGCNIDTIECYDSQVRPIVFGAAIQLDLPAGFISAQTRLYDELKRAFAFGNAMGNFFVTTTSFFQGCALSQV